MNFLRLLPVSGWLLGGYIGAISAGSIDAAETVTTHPQAQVELLGVARIPGTMIDLSGQNIVLEDGSRADYLGGMSAIDYTGADNRFIVLADRGAGDGAVTYACRYHEVELVLDQAKHDIQFKLMATHLFKSSQDEPLTGSLAVHEKELQSPQHRVRWTAFDPEGIRRLRDGNLLVSDEYGPHLVITAPSGRVVRELPIPKTFTLRQVVEGEVRQGVFPNRGLEGIAISANGNRAVAVLQSPLIQDGEIVANQCHGLNCRWLVYDDAQPSKQVVYSLENVATGVSELLAVDEDRYLVLERDSKSGLEAAFKKIFIADIASATDVTHCESLPPYQSPSGVTVAKKHLLLDLLDPAFGLAGEQVAEKPEGLSWGPKLADGRRTLWVCCDNDCDPAVQSQIYCFAVAGLD